MDHNEMPVLRDQSRTPEEVRGLLECLWKRGGPADARAVNLVRAANRSAPLPAFLAAPPGVRLSCALGPDDAEAGVRLLEGTYWNEGVSAATMVQSFLHATAWVGAKDDAGTLIAMARALSDTVKFAQIFDVVVAPSWRGKGVGKAIVRLVLDHPAVRHARRVRLGTRDAQGLYAKFGFRNASARVPVPSHEEMVLER